MAGAMIRGRCVLVGERADSLVVLAAARVHGVGETSPNPSPYGLDSRIRTMALNARHPSDTMFSYILLHSRSACGICNVSRHSMITKVGRLHKDLSAKILVRMHWQDSVKPLSQQELQ